MEAVFAIVVLLVLGGRVIWKNYFSRDFQKSFPNLTDKSDFNYSCPRGWERPVRRALRELSRLRKEKLPDLQVLQIKEKFGRLRIYILTIDDEGPTVPIIEKAKRACYFRCQICGKSGRHCVLDKWHFTLCERCEQTKKAARKL